MPTKTPGTTSTAPSPADRLAAAKAAEQAARDRLTELRQRHIAGEKPVSAEEFGSAGHALELSELEREGAELAFAEAQRQERLAKLTAIADDITARAHPSSATDAFERAAAALADLIDQCGPARTRMIAAWQRELHALGVPSVNRSERPAAEDAGLAWRDTSWGGVAACVIRTASDGKLQAVRGYDLWALLDAIVARACRQAGVPTHLFNHTGQAQPGLVESPGEWFASN